VISIVGFIGFIWREITYRHAAVKLSLLKNWNLALGSILNFVVGMVLLATVFVFPLFVQIGLGWTATQTGNFLISGALASAVSMALVGRLLTKGYNPKMIMIVGTIMVFAFAAIMSFSSPDASESFFFWPFILRGLGIGFMLSPVMALSLQGIHKSEIPQAAGLSNMIRQLGGAVGIAVMNVILIHKNAANEAVMLQHTNVYNDAFNDRVNMLTQNFASQGYFIEDAKMLAYKLTDLSVFKQQSLVSYDNIFWLVAVAVLFCIPIILLIKNKKSSGMAKVDVHLD